MYGDQSGEFVCGYWGSQSKIKVSNHSIKGKTKHDRFFANFRQHGI